MPEDISAILDVASSSPEPSPTEPVQEPISSEPVSDPAPEPEPQPTEPGAEPSPEPSPDTPVDGRTNPAAIRSALKALRDADPKNAPVVNELRDGYGRYLAYKQTFSNVADARAAKTFLEANGGIEGLTGLHETLRSVEATDALLYAGDPKVLDNIIEDMRKENKLDSFSKLASPYLDKLRSLDEKAYLNTLRPHFYQNLVDMNVPGWIELMRRAVSGETPDLESAKGLLSEFSTILDNIKSTVEKSARPNLDPEWRKLEEERSNFANQQKKEFNDSVGAKCDSYSNTALGTALKPYLKLPFFKNLITGHKDALPDLARGIKAELLAQFGDGYTKQMDAFFAASKPDRTRIEKYHQDTVDGVAARVVRSVIERRYPNYAKAAAVPPKPTAPNAPTGPTEPGKPEFVKTKPIDSQIDWDRDPTRMLFITGRAYLRGSGKLVQWGKAPK